MTEKHRGRHLSSQKATTRKENIQKDQNLHHTKTKHPNMCYKRERCIQH